MKNYYIYNIYKLYNIKINYIYKDKVKIAL